MGPGKFVGDASILVDSGGRKGITCLGVGGKRLLHVYLCGYFDVSRLELIIRHGKLDEVQYAF